MKTIARGNCGFCGGEHENVSPILDTPALCEICQACYHYCEHMPNCTWPSDTVKDNPASTTASSSRADIPKVADSLATKNLQEAFESWFVSTNLLGTKASPEDVYHEFEQFVKEILAPVDTSKQYLQMVLADGKVKDFTMLDASKLYRNQNGEYVVVEGKRRNRIGKNVAVMG